MVDDPAQIPDVDGEPGSSPRDQMATGRYLAENGRWFVQLRIGPGKHPTVSADLQTRDATGLVELSMVTRGKEDTNEDDDQDPDEVWLAKPQGALFSDGLGGASEGTVQIRVKGGGLVETTFTLTGGVSGLVPGFTVTVTAARVSTALRDVGLEIECEAGVFEAESRSELADAAGELREVLGQAGLDVHNVGSTTVIPPPANGRWATSDVFTTLQKQLRDAAQAPLTSPVWELHLLLLSRSDRKGLLGVMPDFADDLPRQGAAIFVDAIRDTYPDSAEWSTRILTTAIHELGHCLNLTHRFTRDVGRADSTSFMNYDWVYRGGGQIKEYWTDRSDPIRGGTGPEPKRTFDSDELKFLHHGPREQVIPGGAPFGSARYWTTASGGSVSPPADPARNLQLWLTPPPTGTQFNYLDPVFLQLSLRNAGDRPRFMPRFVLDVKAGMLEVLIHRRSNRIGTRPTTSEPFMPIMRRCYSLAGADGIWLYPGESLHNNLNLAFGSAGFPFAEPGDYLITPILTLFNEAPDSTVAGEAPFLSVIEGAALSLSILPPMSKAHKRDADLLLRNDVGASLALGGADCLTAAAETLKSISDRRRRDDRGGRPDGLMAATARMLGMQAARHENRSDAISWFNAATDPAALSTFDPHTAEHTRLRALEVAGQRRAGRTAYLDLAVSAGGGQQHRTVPGVVVTSKSGETHQSLLLVDAAGFAEQAPEPGAAIRPRAIVSATDGSTEEIEIESLDIFGEPGGRTMAVAHLHRNVPAESSVDHLDLKQLWDAGEGATAAAVMKVLADVNVVVSADTDGKSDAGPLKIVEAAARTAPWGLNVTPTPATVRSMKWQQIAFIFCLFTNRCQEGPKIPQELLPGSGAPKTAAGDGQQIDAGPIDAPTSEGATANPRSGTKGRNEPSASA